MKKESQPGKAKKSIQLSMHIQRGVMGKEISLRRMVHKSSTTNKPAPESRLGKRVHGVRNAGTESDYWGRGGWRGQKKKLKEWKEKKQGEGKRQRPDDYR